LAIILRNIGAQACFILEKVQRIHGKGICKKRKQLGQPRERSLGSSRRTRRLVLKMKTDTQH